MLTTYFVLIKVHMLHATINLLNKNKIISVYSYCTSTPSRLIVFYFTAGRTHQLRVHCLYIGHRIVGDYMYSNRTDVSPYRMMLHAYRLIIPMSHCTIDVTAPDPFTPDTDSKWTVLKTFFTYVEYVDEYGLKEAYS